MRLIEALDDPATFKQAMGDPATWARHRVLFKAIFGEPLNGDELEIYRHHTGRSEPPAKPFREIVEVIGRRGGKTRSAALLATYFACFVDYTPYVAPGEVVTIALISVDRKQARNLKRYIEGFFRVPMLKALLKKDATVDAIVLKSGVQIEILTASMSVTRGYTYAAVIGDEVAFWRGSDESSNPAAEILRAIRPGMATIPTSKLIIISTPYAKMGAFHGLFQKHFGVDGSPVLVWRGTTLEMNPTIDPAIIAEAREEDPEAASSEYDAQFRDDISAYISADVVYSLVVKDRAVLPRAAEISYGGFSDVAGGSGGDSYTSAVAHRENDGMIVIDALLETRPPFSPEQTTAEHAQFFKSYGVTKVQGDYYAGLWPRERFATHQIDYVPSAKPKSDLYREFVTLLNSGKVQLLDNRRLISQLIGLERKTGRGGRDSIDHSPGSHDDIVNSCVGVAMLVHHRELRKTPHATPIIIRSNSRDTFTNYA